MNIIVKPYGSSLCYCRPDTTWERENKDFYSPECVKELHWAPIVFARISKAGKCIGGKFVSRYYDGYSFGVLLYCNDGPLAFTSCADHTSRLMAFALGITHRRNLDAIATSRLKDSLTLDNSNLFIVNCNLHLYKVFSGIFLMALKFLRIV